MFEQLITPQLAQATWRTKLHGPKPQPCYLYFGEDWLSHKWIQNKYWKITETVLVPYDVGRITPGSDEINLNLSNADGALKLYPSAESNIYEILVGLKPGAYQLGVYIPGPDNFLLALGDSSMRPDVTDADRRYLGKFAPEDTTYENPLLKLWAIHKMPAWILKLYVEGVDFERVIIGFKIAKHRVEEIAKPDVFTTVPYFDSIKGTW